ncbi:MAG: OmpA family protein [Bacteroidia bacterium]|nr:OmpA family protein [Bacteroidia bacterium]
MKTTLALGTIFLTLFFLSANAQNLVVNPSFEEVQTSRGAVSLINPISAANNWNSPNKGIPKVYASSAEGYVHDEYGSSWNFKARSGKHVAGIFVYGGSNMDYSTQRGYIQGALSKPLEVGKKYYFSFWVHYHCEGSNKIGITFLPEKTQLASPGLIRMEPATYQKKVSPYNQTEWTVVQDSFIAYKAFNTFIIGNFFRNDETELESNNYGHHFAYIDDVSVVEAPNQDTEAPELDRIEMMKWEMNAIRAKSTSLTRLDTSPELEDLSSPQLDAFFAREIFFDLGSSFIRPEEKEYLGVLVEQMKEKEDFEVIIKGFASDEGTDPSNLTLSMARAEAVKKFFRTQGINSMRLYIRALGEVEGPGDEERGKEFNRRVEFEIVYK